MFEAAAIACLYLLDQNILPHPLHSLVLSVEQDPDWAKERIQRVNDDTIDKEPIFIRTGPNPFLMNVVLKNTGKSPVVLKFRVDPKGFIDFSVRKGGRTVSDRTFGDSYGGFMSLDYLKTITIPAGEKHVIPVSMGFVIPEKHKGPGTYHLWCFFWYWGREISSKPLTLVVPAK